MSNYNSLDEMLTVSSAPCVNPNDDIYKHRYKASSLREYINMFLLCIGITINSAVLYIIVSELHTFSNVFSSFKSDIHTDITNFNDFLHVVPKLKEVLTIILNLCNSESIHPFCNNSTKQYIEL